MTLLAIDPSLNSTGLAWFGKDDIEVGTIGIRNHKGPDRLLMIREDVSYYLDETKAEYVVYEDYAFGAKGRAIFQIGELGGVLKTLCYERGVNVLLVPPSTLKLFATGKGNSDKEAVILAVHKRWKRYLECSDEADAYALLKLGEAYLDTRKRRGCSEAVKESMAKIELIAGRQRTKIEVGCNFTL